MLAPFSPPRPLGLFLKLPNKTTSPGDQNGVGPFSSPWIDPWRWPKDRSSGDEKSLWSPPKRITLVRRSLLFQYCERFEPRSYFKRLSLIVRMNVVLNRTVVIDSD